MYISCSFIMFYCMFTWVNTPTTTLNIITTLWRDRFLCGAATGLPLSAMAAMSAVPLQVGSRRTPPALPSMVSTRDRA